MFAYFRRFTTAPGFTSLVAILSIQIMTIPTAAAAGQPRPRAEQISPAKWRPWFQLGGYALDRERGEGELWLPIFQDNKQVLFGEVKGKLFETDAREVNLALGYRSRFGEDFVLGAWAGYDLRQSEQGNTFHQIAGGFEALSRDIDFRANWYVPINRTQTTFSDLRTTAITTTTSVADFDNGGISVFNTSTTVFNTTGSIAKEHALFGVDAEVGLRIPLEKIFANARDADSWWKKNELRIYAGGYFFDSPEADQPIVGPRARLEWRINDIIPNISGSRLTFEAAYQYDEVRSDQFEVGMRLKLPFGSNGWGNPASRDLTYQEQRMDDAIQRDTDIVASIQRNNYKHKKSKVNHSRERALDDATGTRLDRAVLVDARSDLNYTLSQVGGNSLIIASGAHGDFVNQYVTVLDNQTLMGGGASLSVRGSQSGRRVTFNAPGSRPTIVQRTNDEVILVGSNTHLTGIDVRGGGDGAGHFNRGVATTNRYQQNILIEDINIRDTDGHGIRFDSAIDNWIVRNATISGVTDGAGIDIEDRNNNFEISNVEFSDISLRSGDAIHLSGANTGTISDNIFGPEISDFLIRLKKDNVISGSGNINLGGNDVYQFFGDNNQLDIGFDLPPIN